MPRRCGSPRRAVRRWQHATAFVEADGVDADPGLLGDLSDLHADPFLTLDLGLEFRVGVARTQRVFEPSLPGSSHGSWSESDADRVRYEHRA